MNIDESATARRITVLMYHRVGHASNDWERKYCVSPELFASHMTALKRRGMQPVSIDELFEWLQGARPLPATGFVLTFDDGFRGVYEHAFPLLAGLGWPATIFLVSSLIGKEDEWCRRENPTGRTYPLLTRDDIEEMSRAGISFHSHSRTHPDLTRLSGGALADELSGARRDLENVLGRPVRYFAYPYGRYNQSVLEATKAAGYSAAFSVQPGFNRPDVDPFQIRRLDVFGTDSSRELLRKVTFGSNDGTWRHAIRYYGGRLAARLR